MIRKNVQQQIAVKPIVTVASAIALRQCRVKRMNANELVPSLADILAGIRAEVFRPGADFEASVTGNGSVDVLATAARPRANVPAWLIKTGIGRDKQPLDMTISVAGHRMGTQPAGSDPITASMVLTPEPGGEAAALLMFAEAVQSGQFYPCAFALEYHASTPVKATLTVAGADAASVTKIYAITNGSTFFDNVTRLLEAHLDTDPTNDEWDESR
jgi:hypothetical protein